MKPWKFVQSEHEVFLRELDWKLGKDSENEQSCRGPTPEEMLGLHHAPAENASTEAVRLYRASHPGIVSFKIRF